LETSLFVGSGATQSLMAVIVFLIHIFNVILSVSVWVDHGICLQMPPMMITQGSHAEFGLQS